MARPHWRIIPPLPGYIKIKDVPRKNFSRGTFFSLGNISALNFASKPHKPNKKSRNANDRDFLMPTLSSR